MEEEPAPAEQASKPPERAAASQHKSSKPQEEPRKSLAGYAASMPAPKVSEHARLLENLLQEQVPDVRKLIELLQKLLE